MNKAYLFDVDGVLTDLFEKKVIYPEIFERIIKLLEEHNPVGLNTGRSAGFVEEQIINPLLDRIKNRALLENFFAVAEKGGIWITYSKDGTIKHERSNEVAVSNDLQDKIKTLVKDKYSDSMFVDETKETMITVEMADGFDLATFHKRQHDLHKEIMKLLLDSGLQSVYKVDVNTIAIDIESPKAGKALGADRFEEFLRDKGIKVEKYETFGDSKSDFDMADELHRRGQDVEMVYVGDKEKLGDFEKGYPVNYVGGFSSGTANYLEQQ
jgi:hydroxymethylpyrimidine pyrophosphatase-like HAD family hydrolase